MDPATATLILGIISVLIERGVPAYIEWASGEKLENPTIEDIEALKVKKMSDKAKDSEE